jgi:hypothetical protein
LIDLLRLLAVLGAHDALAAAVGECSGLATAVDDSDATLYILVAAVGQVDVAAGGGTVLLLLLLVNWLLLLRLLLLLLLLFIKLLLLLLLLLPAAAGGGEVAAAPATNGLVLRKFYH